ncbi:hypothetical protein [Deinococcus frigens]|uniref:hypothetical protein n=1 Tax=Deinococcus frigens TaxID=249403 RepID=UPI000494DEEF|nr:hypothetical protein [Deinococcus frigens]
MTAAKILIDNEGRVQTDAETLEKLKNQQFELQANGHIVPSSSRPRRLHEIEDVAERMAAYEELVGKIAHHSGARLPDDWATIRDSIYD